jgi:hypothetical protein
MNEIESIYKQGINRKQHKHNNIFEETGHKSKTTRIGKLNNALSAP